ncbi:YtxH domain-containing protein [Paenibacillus roseipurpureus]|uniref:YtxH domain-containing protein n=1 Tax=Paenibacillus roseopurpureus TaxID=2918901 RepID=A0AA96LK60_9BACL|nr:YtxH domain-containing protein [Paenibacillus sp. MBLB1832]WNR43245.1 YtxH domain-containing protein [Paenibacillus sp. MBLB1832]
MSNGKKGKDLLIGAVVGGLVGAAAALLFAPKSGRELRSDIAQGATAVSDKTVQVATAVSQKTQAAAKTVSTTTTDFVSKAKDTAASVVDTVRSWKEAPVSEELVEDLDLELDIEASEAAEDLVIVGR